MKKNKGFTLIEVIITLAISAMMCFAIAAFLYAGYSTFEKVIDQKRKVEQLRTFRVKLNAQLRSLTRDQFLFGNPADGYQAVPVNQVKLARWEMAAYGVQSNWQGLVYRQITFYVSSMDDNGNSVYRRCEYSFQNNNINYREWIIPIDPLTGLLPPLVDAAGNPNPVPAMPPIVQQVLMKNVNDMQITSSLYAIDQWEDYPAAAPAAVRANRIQNMRLKIYIDVNNPMVLYWSCINLGNRALTMYTKRFIPANGSVSPIEDGNEMNY